MGPRHCTVCDVLLKDYGGDVPWNSCQNSYCPALEKQICARCADTDKPTCRFCAPGNSCSMCWLIGPHILQAGRNNYQSQLAPRCQLDDCPMYWILEDEDRCLECWERDVQAKFGRKLDLEEEHRVWTIEKCGHEVCEANQLEMKCKNDKECSVCKEEAEYAAKKEKQVAEEARVRSDVALMRTFVDQVSSESAKFALEQWLKKHDLKRDEDEPNSKMRKTEHAS